MESLNDCISEYRKQMEKGVIQKAYRGLVEYIKDLRIHFSNKYPDFSVSENIYYGYMDMTYFSISPKAFKERKLKIALVFIHDTLRFEGWLSGHNKQVQSKYWGLIKESQWNKYHLTPDPKGVDYIIDCTLADNPDFSNPDTLTEQIEKGIISFINDIDGFLAKH